MPELTIHTTTYDPDLAVDGDYGPDMETGTERIDVESVVELIDVLRREGLTAPSAWPMPDNPECVWYSDPDGYTHPYSGRHEERSGHLDGLTRAECAMVYQALRDAR